MQKIMDLIPLQCFVQLEDLLEDFFHRILRMIENNWHDYVELFHEEMFFFVNWRSVCYIFVAKYLRIVLC